MILSFLFLFSSNSLKTEDDAGSSPCEGRVQVSYDNEEEATRTLSIVHFFLFFSFFCKITD